jgi:predicted amidohydrolase
MSNTLTFTLIQTQLHWEDKQANLAMLTQKINAIQEPTEIIVLPEMFATGFSMQPTKLAENMHGECVSWMMQMAKQKKAIITGSLIIEEEGKYYNRLIWMLPNEQFGYYDKRHCFSYAGEHLHYTPGKKRLIASVKGWKINLQICYDLRFPVWARQAPSPKEKAGAYTPEYDVLLYVANWPHRRSFAWKSLLTARAIENQSYVIGVNRVGNDGNNIYHSGDSMVINALGETLYQKADKEDIVTLTLYKNILEETRNNFQFLKDADTFFLLNED